MAPAIAANNLVEVARIKGFTTRTTALLGTTLESWATTVRPPRWAAYAAALWLRDNATVTDPREQRALALILAEIPGVDPES